MNKSHLLYWIFKYLSSNNPDILENMKSKISNEKWSENATYTIRKSLNESLEDFYEFEKSSKL
jgi:predicted HNH restriction endonuclease